MNEINVAISQVVINKSNEVSMSISRCCKKWPANNVWINCNSFVAREDPFPVVRVFLSFIQLT